MGMQEEQEKNSKGKEPKNWVSRTEEKESLDNMKWIWPLSFTELEINR